MSTEQQTVKTRRSRRLYVYWAIALTLLLAAGLFSWLVVVPVWRTRAAVMEHHVLTSGASSARENRPSGITQIENLGGEATAARKLAMYLRLPRYFVVNRDTATHLLSCCGEPAVPVLIELLKDEDEHVRYHSVWGLARTGDERAIEPLKELLDDPDGAVQQAASLVIRELRDRKEREGTKPYEVFIQFGSQPLFGMSSSSPPHLRIGAFRELTDKRSELEDRLRRRVLEIFHDETRLHDLRGVLNEPWTTESVKLIGDLVADDLRAGIGGGRGTLDWSQKARLLDLLAYVGCAYDVDVSREAVAAFDGLWPLLLEEAEKCPIRRSKFTALNALASHGSSVFMTDAFWRYYEATGDGYRFLANAGDQAALERLRTLQKKNHWKPDSSKRRSLDDAAKIIEASLKSPEIRNIRRLGDRLRAAERFLFEERNPKFRRAKRRKP
jgi:hypothetical protein